MARINAFATPAYPVIFSALEEIEDDGIPKGHSGIAIAILVQGIPTFLATHVVPQSRLDRVLESLRQGDARVAVVGLPIDTSSTHDSDATEDHSPSRRPAAFVSMVCGDGRRLTVARILGPGGKLVITDLDSHEHAFLRTEHHDRWMGFERGEVRNWFRAAGLDDVSVEGIDEECCSTSHEGQHAAISIFVAYGAKPTASLLP